MTGAVEETLTLPSAMDLDAVDSIRDWLLPAVEAGNVLLDASKVERVATNTLLMLASAAQTARSQKFGFLITNPSAALSDAIARLGMNDIFSGIVKDE